MEMNANTKPLRIGNNLILRGCCHKILKVEGFKNMLYSQILHFCMHLMLYSIKRAEGSKPSIKIAFLLLITSLHLAEPFPKKIIFWFCKNSAKEFSSTTTSSYIGNRLTLRIIERAVNFHASSINHWAKYCISRYIGMG